MKIVVAGTHGVGKTTLARVLSERLGLVMIEEVARKIIKNAGYANTRDYIERADYYKKLEVQQRILDAQVMIEVANSREGYVSDRSVFDVVAYAEAYGIKGRMLHDMLGTAISLALDEYDLLVFVPLMFGVVDDGFRDTDERMRLEVEKILRKYLEAYEVLGGRVLKIKSETVEGRVNEVLAELEKLEAVV